MSLPCSRTFHGGSGSAAVLNPREPPERPRNPQHMPVTKLTDAYVRAIKPPSNGRAEYWDSVTPGLCLRVTATGAATWSFRYRPRYGGKAYERVTFGSAAGLTLADAR